MKGLETTQQHACCWNPKPINPITQQLNELSPEERQHVMEDIHGVADKKKESLAFITEQLELFELEIDKVQGKERSAYDLAISMDPSYLNREFRQKFLHMDDFDIQRATTRIMDHFKYKLELFGEEKLVKDIEFDDLSSDVQGLLYTGCLQYLRDKDVTGRTILFVCPELNVPCTWKNFARASWYHRMIALEDEATRQKGIVVVIFFNERCAYRPGNMKAHHVVRKGVPLRCAAIHCCFVNQTLLAKQMLTVLDVMGKPLHVRFRSHVEDSIIHCLYTLQSFGINAKSIPLESDGRPHRKWMLEFIEQQKVIERQRREHGINKSNAAASNSDRLKDSSNATDIVLTSADVILGRGIKFSGNTTLDQLIDMQLTSYSKAPTAFEKSCITVSTMRRIKETGGRFLKKKKLGDSNSHEWIIAQDDEARKTIADRFRKRRTSKR